MKFNSRALFYRMSKEASTAAFCFSSAPFFKIAEIIAVTIIANSKLNKNNLVLSIYYLFFFKAFQSPLQTYPIVFKVEIANPSIGLFVHSKTGSKT